VDVHAGGMSGGGIAFYIRGEKIFSELKQNLKKDLSSLPSLKLALLGDSATQFLAIAIRGMGAARGFNIELFEAEYNQIERQALDRQSELYQFNPQYTIIFQSTHKLLGAYNNKPVAGQSSLADKRLDFIRVLTSVLPGRIIYFNYPEIDDAVFGSFANKVSSSFLYQVRHLNYELMNLSAVNTNLFICDAASIQNVIGRAAMFNPSIYTTSEMVLSLDTLPVIASRCMDIVCAAEGRMKKCVVLDLDNTLWGGVIGDDGIENIQLGHGLGIGKVFSELQQWLKRLKERGIILAVCSKNREETAKEPFLKHPEMVLKLDDIAVFKANWNNKADNIREIQSILNIGFDSMVFLDDNPAERALVRENIPGITVPELPEDPACYLEYLYALNLFETISYSAQDAERVKQYQLEAARTSLQKTFTNEADFLKSLDMVCEVRGFDTFNTPRAAQLSQRSNQFNLRTVRYTEADIKRISLDEKYAAFTFSLSDKFGDHGLICVVILEKTNADTLFIDTWLMSCRVLKRGMELFTLNTIAAYARENGFTRIIGEYIPSAKNAMVEGHYTGLGFAPLHDPAGRLLFELPIENRMGGLDYQSRECYIGEG
jgi:FkbH-like protein